MSFWAVIQTEPQRERLAVEHLGMNGFETYLPRIKIRKLGRTRTPPLFPTYVFVRIIDQWWAARWALGVVRILMAGQRPEVLKDRVVDEIRNREVGGFVKLKPAPKIRKGQRVRVTSGSFMDQVGIYDGQTARERERVLLELLGRMVPVELAQHDKVEAIQDIALGS